MRVLVSGAGGFVGGHVLAACPPTWAIVALSRRALPDPVGGTAVRLDDPFGPLPERLAGEFDAVIHLAGNADHGLAIREPWADLAATGGVAAALLGRVAARRLVVLSSAAVYAGRQGLVDPSLPLAPPMAYALSKLYVEGFARSVVADGAADGAVVIRLYNAYGPGERPSRLVPRVVEAMRTGASFRLTGATSSMSDPLHVADVARALVAAVTVPIEEPSRCLTIDLCGGDPRPLPEQVGRIATALGSVAPQVVLAPDPDQVPIAFWSDPRPAVERLALGDLMSFEVGVRSYAAAVGWLAG